MHFHLEFWNFVADSLAAGQPVVLLVVAQSSGSSPGRAGYKMAVTASGQLFGSIGGGVMEVNLADQCRAVLTGPRSSLPASARLIEQVHQKHSPDASGMICSGRQTVIIKKLTPENIGAVNEIINAIRSNQRSSLIITADEFRLEPADNNIPQYRFEKRNDSDFLYREMLDSAKSIYIVGGGHCALALSEMMSKLDFRITVFDDRPVLNTIDKNNFADVISIINSYENLAAHIPDGDDVYVVVMTVGYASDKIVIRQLCARDFKYFGVLGSRAKMATLLRELKDEGVPAEILERIRTPIGIPINSRTPEEIAVSIAAEIIAVKNSTEREL